MADADAVKVVMGRHKTPRREEAPLDEGEAAIAKEILFSFGISTFYLWRPSHAWECSVWLGNQEFTATDMSRRAALERTRDTLRRLAAPAP
jgi:hypothetical protein